MVRWSWFLLALLPTYLALGQSMPYGHNPVAGHYQSVRGIQLYYETYGAGPPLLLLHGNGNNIAAFAHNIPTWAQHHRVIAVDSRAHGQSVDVGDSLGFEQLAGDFADLLTQLHLDSVDVVGWSDGGIAALLLALRHPARVRRLVTSGANLSPDSLALTPALWQQQQQGYQANRHPVFADAKRRNDWKVFRLDVFQLHIPLTALPCLSAPAFIVAGDRDYAGSHAGHLSPFTPGLALDCAQQRARHLTRAGAGIQPASGSLFAS